MPQQQPWLPQLAMLHSFTLHGSLLPGLAWSPLNDRQAARTGWEGSRNEAMATFDGCLFTEPGRFCVGAVPARAAVELDGKPVSQAANRLCQGHEPDPLTGR